MSTITKKKHAKYYDFCGSPLKTLRNPKYNDNLQFHTIKSELLSLEHKGKNYVAVTEVVSSKLGVMPQASIVYKITKGKIPHR